MNTNKRHNFNFLLSSRYIIKNNKMNQQRKPNKNGATEPQPSTGSACKDQETST